jgi:hypothetical protein
MEQPSLIDQQFTDGYNEAHDDYDADRLEECESKLRGLLGDPAIPRYQRMKSLVLLGLIVGDWQEADKCYIKGDALWQIVRRWEPEGNVEVDEALQEIRDSLDGLDTALFEENPEFYDRLERLTDAQKLVYKRDDSDEEEEEQTDDTDFDDNSDVGAGTSLENIHRQINSVQEDQKAEEQQGAEENQLRGCEKSQELQLLSIHERFDKWRADGDTILATLASVDAEKNDEMITWMDSIAAMMHARVGKGKGKAV